MKKFVCVFCAGILALSVLAAGACKKMGDDSPNMPEIPNGVVLPKVEKGEIAGTFAAFNIKYGESANLRADFAFEESFTRTQSGDMAYDYRKQLINVKYIVDENGRTGDADAKINETSSVRKNEKYTVSSPDYAKYNYSTRDIKPYSARLRGEGIYLYSKDEKSYKNDRLQYSADGLKAYYSDFADFGILEANATVLVKALGTGDIFTTVQPTVNCLVSSISGGQSPKIGNYDCPSDKLNTTYDVRADGGKFFMDIKLSAAFTAADGTAVDYSVKTSLYLDTAAEYTSANFDGGKPLTTQTSGVRYLDIDSADFYEKFFGGEQLSFETKGGGDPSALSFSKVSGRFDFEYVYGGENGAVSVNYLYADGVLTLADAFAVFESGLGEKFDAEKLDYIYTEITALYRRTVGSGENTRLYECKTALFIYYEKPE